MIVLDVSTPSDAEVLKKQQPEVKKVDVMFPSEWLNVRASQGGWRNDPADPPSKGTVSDNMLNESSCECDTDQFLHPIMVLTDVHVDEQLGFKPHCFVY